MPDRVFKTLWFSKAAKKSRMTDEELCLAIGQVMLGQANDVGGGVYKKLSGRSLYRSIIIARGGRYWVYAYLFASKIGQLSIAKNSQNFVCMQRCTYRRQMWKSHAMYRAES